MARRSIDSKQNLRSTCAGQYLDQTSIFLHSYAHPIRTAEVDPVTLDTINEYSK
jgi:hypothetical protein